MFNSKVRDALDFGRIVFDTLLKIQSPRCRLNNAIGCVKCLCLFYISFWVVNTLLQTKYNLDGYFGLLLFRPS